MGGSSKKQTVGYRYYLDVHAVLVHGPIDKITRFTVDDKVAWSGTSTGGSIAVNAKNLFGGDEREGGVAGTIDIDMGGPSQPRNAYLQSKLGTDIPAFRGVVGLIFRQFYWGNNPYLKRWAVRGSRIQTRQNGMAQWYPAKADISGDMNPAHIIRELLTDPDWGMGYPEADIDDASFQAAADTLYAEGLGISILWDREQPIRDFHDVILSHIDGVTYVDRATGKFVLRLARGGYSLSGLPVYDESTISKITEFTRPTIAELVNTVTVVYWDKSTGKDGSLTLHDTALISQQGFINAAKVQYPGVTNGANANKLASRDLRALSTPLASVVFVTTRAGAALNIGDVFKFSWAEYGVSQLVLRVTNLDYGSISDNLIKVTAVEDTFAVGSAIYAPPPASAWVDPIGDPLPMVNRVLSEVPYYLLAREFGDAAAQALAATAGYAMAGGTSPGNGAISALVYSDDGAGYSQQATVSMAPLAVLQAALVPEVRSTVAIAGGVDLDTVAVGDLVQLGTGATSARELAIVVSVTDSLLVIDRGALDTVPAPVASGTTVLFLGRGESLAALNEEYATGETVKVKLLTTTPKGTLALASAPEDTLVVSGRQAKPYPPGNVKINGSAYPAAILGAYSISWSHRSRLQQTGQIVTPQNTANIGPEAGTTYTLRLYGETDTLLRTETGLTGTSYTWGSEGADSGLGAPGQQNVDTIFDPADTYWANVVSLAHANGYEGQTSLSDEKGVSWTRSGSAALSSSQAKTGATALLIPDINSDFNTASGLLLTTDIFTIEGFFYLLGAPFYTAYPIHPLISASINAPAGEFQIFVNAPSYKLSVDLRAGASGDGSLTGTTTISLNRWYHFAATWDGTTWRIFLDGNLEASAAKSFGWKNTGAPIRLGRSTPYTSANWSAMNGLLDEVRITKGVARYTANFAPPTGIDEYWDNVVALLHFNGPDASTTFFDERGHTFTAFGNAQIDTAQSKFGGASGLFDGSGDYLKTPTSADFGMGAGDYTFEGWCRPSANSGARTLVDTRVSDSITVQGIGIYSSVLGDGKLSFTNNASVLATSVNIVPLNVWTHIAITRQGGTVRGFINGNLEFTVVDSRTLATSASMGFAGISGGTQNFEGHLDDWRVTKGVARYTASFTPPVLAYPSGASRLNGRIRFELESVRDGLTSFQHHNISVDRTGWGYNWGKYWGGPAP